MGLDKAVLELDGNSEGLNAIAGETTETFPDVAAANARARSKQWKFGPFTLRGGDLRIPIGERSVARLIELLGRSAEPEVATWIRVFDSRGLLLDAPDIGDNDIWVSARVPA